jgi:PAS domain S-box-containing protein
MALAYSGIAAASDAQPGKEKPLRVAVYKDYAPFTFISASGNLAGLFIDFWQLWSEHNKIPVEFVPSDWPGTLEAVKAGKADVHSGLFVNPEREAWMAFAPPLFETNTGLYYRSKDQPPATLDDLTGTRVGVLAGTHQLAWLKKNHPGVQAVEFTDTAPALRALLKGDIRALFDETPSADVEIARVLAHGEVARIPKNVLSNTVNPGVPKANAALAARIGEGMGKIPLAALADAERRWLSNPADRYWERRQDTLFTPEQKAWLATKPLIRLAVTDFIKPVDIVDSQGRYSGFNADLMALLSRRIGVQVVPVFHKTWPSVVERAIKGEVDGALSLSKTPEREESLLFTTPYAYDPIIAVVKAGRRDVAAWEDLAGKRVTITEKTPMEKRIRDLVKDGSVEIVKDEREGLTKVQEGAADVHVTWLIPFGSTQRQGRIPNLQVAISEDAEGGDFRIGVHKSRPMVADVLARGLRQISEEELAALRRKWFSVDEKDEGGIVLTDAEKAWLEAHKTIRVGLAGNRPPLESRGAGGGYEGFNVDILRIVSGLMNVSMSPVDGLSWVDALRRASEKQIDVVVSAAPTPELKGSLIFTKPFQKFRMVIVTSPRTPEMSYLAELGGKSVGVLRGSPAEAALASDFPDVKAVAFESTLDGLKAVDANKIDAYAGNGVVVSYLMAKHGMENLRQSVAEQPYEMRMGVRADWPELVVILNKALAAISDNDRDAILHAWTKLRVERSTDWGMVVKVALGLLIIGGVITTIILVANRKLSREVAERKKAEKAILAAQAEMTQIFNTSAGGMRVVGKDFTVLKVNDAFLELSGYSREELVGNKCHEHFGGMECDTEDCTLRRILTGEPRVEGTVVKQHKDGMPIYCDVAATPFLSPDGEVLGVIEDFRDMTERMKAQHLVKQSESKYRELVESASSIILKLDMEGNVTFFNEFAQSFFGFTPEEIMGKPIVGTIVPEKESGGRDLAALIRDICANPGQFEKNENENIRKDGRRVWISWTNKVILDDVFNKPKGLLCIGLDATERKKAQDGLHEALEIISGSIRYASRIQRAILPQPETFLELMPKHFAVWEPRDVVGGDVYWIRSWGEGVLLILADCTGHGVPGAFITLISSGALDRAVAQTAPGDPAALIALMNKYVKVVLSQELQYGQEDSSDDGLELGVCYIPPDRESVVFAGAHFQLFTVNGGDVEIIKGDRKGIGYRFVSFDAAYENRTVQALPGQRFYMTTDGLIDQIGGAPRRSFGKKRFTDLLASLGESPLPEQGAVIFDTIEKHRGEESRRDDICVIGFEL